MKLRSKWLYAFGTMILLIVAILMSIFGILMLLADPPDDPDIDIGIDITIGGEFGIGGLLWDPSGFDLPNFQGTSVLSVYSESSNYVYFREGSFGNYTGQGWADAESYAEAIDGYGMQNSTSDVLTAADGSTYGLDVGLHGKTFAYPYHNVFGSGEVMQESDILNQGNASASYSAEFYDYYYQFSGLPEGSLSEDWANAEEQYRDYVYDNYTYVPAKTQSYFQGIIDEMGFRADDPDIIARVTSYIHYAADYDLSYDTALNSEPDVAVSFLSEYKAGNSLHFASATTLLLRSLGIPARYTVGYVCLTEAGDVVEVTDYDAHAWTEVYLDGFGWVNIDSTNPDNGPWNVPPFEFPFEGPKEEPPEEIPLRKPHPTGQLIFTIRSDSTVYSYLKEGSYGDYTGSGWGKASVYGVTLDGYGLQNSMSAALSSMGAGTYDAEVTMYVSSYPYPYHTVLGSSDVRQADDAFNRGDYSVPYEGTFYDYFYQMNGRPYGSLGSEWAAAEREYRSFVYDNYLSVPSSTQQYLESVIREEGFDAYDPDVIEDVAGYVHNAAEHNENYSSALDYEEDIVVAFLRDYKEGVCQHFASATTLILRTLGIPARYTVGYACRTAAGEVVEVTDYNAHAWTEVYLDGYGWVPIESTGSGNEMGDCELPPIDFPEEPEPEPEPEYEDSGETVKLEKPDYTDEVILSLYSETEEFGYYRHASYGDYTGDGWGSVYVYNETIGGYGMQNIISDALSNAGTDVYDVEVTLHGWKFLYPYYNVIGEGGVVQGNDVVNEGDAYASYTASVYNYDYNRDGTPKSYPSVAWAAAESDYHGFVYKYYLNVPDSVREYFEYIISEENISGTVSGMIRDVLDYVGNAAEFDRDYDDALDDEEDVVLAFLREYKEGDSQHFASAATLMLRTLGIPARYTKGCAATTTAGETVDVTDEAQHAWVEVYLNDFGWVAVDATPQEGIPGGGGGGGTGGGSGIGKPQPTGEVIFSLYSDVEEFGYYRNASFGDYAGDGWSQANVYGVTIYGYGMQNTVSAALSSSRGDVYDVDVTLYGHEFLYPYYNVLGLNGIPLGNDAVNEGDPFAYYTASVYNYSYERDGSPRGTLKGVWADAEADYRTFVYENYLSVPDETRAYLEELIRAEGFSASDPDIINKVTQYVRNAAEYNENYDDALDGEEDIVVAFLRDYKEGICQHYASAAVLLLRMLGIPARYTTGYAASTEAGEIVKVTDKSAHAWAEVYLNGCGWVVAEATPQEGIPGGGGGGGEGEGEGEGGSPGGEGGGEGEGPGVLDTSGDLFPPDAEGGGLFIETPAFSIYSDVERRVYLRLMSYGDYRSNGWNKAERYAATVDGYGMQNSLSVLLSEADMPTYNVTVEIYNSQFVFPYYTVLGSGGIVQGSDVTAAGRTDVPYSASFYDYSYQGNGLLGGSLSGAWAAAERDYRDYVYENYLFVPDETLADLREILRGEGLDPDDPDIINEVAEYVRNAAAYNGDYNEGLDKEGDITVAFLRDYKEGVCRHFASAATLIYRMMGIPARYTIGYSVETAAGETKEVLASSVSHAWVEVYLDGYGWVHIEVTPDEGLPDGEATEPGGDDDERPKYKLTVESPSVQKEYDGTPLTMADGGGRVTYSGELQPYHRVEATFTSRLIHAGTISNDFEVKVYDIRDGSDVTKEYAITKECGTLTMTPRELVIETYSARKAYDGTALTGSSYGLRGLAGNDELSLTFTGYQIERGVSLNTVGDIVIRNEDGIDVTKNYSIEVIYGTLLVY